MQHFGRPSITKNGLLSFPVGTIEASDITTFYKNIPFFLRVPWYTRKTHKGYRFTITEFEKISLSIPSIHLGMAHGIFGIDTLSDLAFPNNPDAISVPHDLLVIGDLPPSSLSVSISKPSLPPPRQPVPSGPVPERSFFDIFLTDKDFIFLFLKTVTSLTISHVQALCDGKIDFPLKVQDRDQILHSIQVGPGFDPRLVAGTYHFESPLEIATDMLFVDTLSNPPRIFCKCTVFEISMSFAN